MACAVNCRAPDKWSYHALLIRPSDVRNLAVLFCFPLLACSTGCAVLYQLAYGDGHKIEAKYSGLKGKRVAVVCVMNPSTYGDGEASTRPGRSGRDDSPTEGRRHRDRAAGRSRDWMDTNEWDESDFVEIGRGVKADMVVAIDIDAFSIHESKTLLKGRSRLSTTVYDMAKNGEVVFRTTDDEHTFPTTHAVSVLNANWRTFERTYIQVLAEHIAKNFYDYNMAEDFAVDGRGVRCALVVVSIGQHRRRRTDELRSRSASSSRSTTRRMPTARPVSGSTSTIVPLSRTSCVATSKWVGRNVSVVSITRSISRPKMLSKRPGHADVALKRGAAGQDLFVGGGHVGVRAEHGGDAAVEVAAHQLLVAGGLGVEVEQRITHVAGAVPARTRSARVHGQSTGRMNTPPSRLKTATSTPLAAAHDGPVAAGRRRGKVGRLDDVGSPSSSRIDLAAAIDVVAQRDAIDAGRDQFAVDRGREARAAGRVLGVGDHQVRAASAAQARQARCDRSAGPVCRRCRR